MFPKIGVKTPKIMNFNKGVPLFSPSILEVFPPYFLEVDTQIEKTKTPSPREGVKVPVVVVVFVFYPGFRP